LRVSDFGAPGNLIAAQMQSIYCSELIAPSHSTFKHSALLLHAAFHLLAVTMPKTEYRRIYLRHVLGAHSAAAPDGTTPSSTSAATNLLGKRKTGDNYLFPKKN
jgi:hypothetical protein